MYSNKLFTSGSWHKESSSHSLGNQVADEERMMPGFGSVLWVSFGALTLLVFQQEGQLAHKNCPTCPPKVLFVNRWGQESQGGTGQHWITWEMLTTAAVM